MSKVHRVDYKVEKGVAYVLLNRSPVNAIDHLMIDAIHDRLREADDDQRVRCVIIGSKLPGIFCGGMDLRMILEGDAQNLRNFVYKLYLGTMNIQYEMGKPTIVAIYRIWGRIWGQMKNSIR